ncbi:MAG TPA: dihydroxyacetone kinase [Actinobacteria bacterium]|nr:dihydroxyacetone kinase [Actinomycetota bacterium]
MILPDLMQDVQAFTRLGVPFCTVRTVWMFGFQRRFVRRWECEMLFPKPGPLPQTSQLAATVHSFILPSEDGRRDPPGGRVVGRQRMPRGERLAERAAWAQIEGSVGVRGAPAPAVDELGGEFAMSPVLSADLVRVWAHHALAGLAAARSHIDALNVFPVPDGDTGTNLFFTVESAASSVDACCEEGQPGVAEAARALGTGALLGARGNSGVILSQILRGIGEVLADAGDVPLDGPAIHALLQRGADLAYEAVAHPVEGTILTVMREAADAAGVSAADAAADAAIVIGAAVRGAEDALARTPSMLEALRLAGVVDAGGQGLVVVLGALQEAISGVPHPLSMSGQGGADISSGSIVPDAERTAVRYAGPAYEVMYLLDAEDHAISDLRQTLDGLGDSLVIVGGEGLWNVHVHVDDAGAAVEAGLVAGSPHQIRITYLGAEARAHGEPSALGARRLIAVSHGRGVTEVLKGADALVVPAQARVRPSTAELLRAAEQAHAREVILLPSDKDTTGVAEIAADQARAQGMRVAVIPTRAVVQTLAAVAMHDPAATFDDDVVAMTRAAGATRYGAVTIASRAALTTAGPCEEGDVLGLVDGDIVVVRADLVEGVREILSGMLAIGGDLVTIVFGMDFSAEDREALSAWVSRTFPLVDVFVIDGEQPLWPVIVGVE